MQKQAYPVRQTMTVECCASPTLTSFATGQKSHQIQTSRAPVSTIYYCYFDPPVCG